IEDDPLTLVDTGPNSGKSLAELEDGLREHGHKVEDLERIVITHQHNDHLAPVIEGFGAHAEANDELAEALMLRHGIPRDVVTALRAVSRAFRGWGGTAPVTTQ